MEQIKSKLVYVSQKAERLFFNMTKHEVAEELGVTRSTLDRRLKEHNWTYAEKLTIDELTKTNVCAN